ncbi:MAG: hypothetical protein K2P84_03505 [Undibacterium sp.]|nr:hypothetical protein [Undibacterium sp.]
MSTNYSKIRFIGYAIPTTDGSLVDIGNPNGPGALAGKYLGNQDMNTDIDNRILVLKNAVELANSKLPVGEDPTSIVNLFVAPEFYFHGVEGPYIYSDSSDGDPADKILQKLQATFPAAQYPNWTFVFGSVITAKVDNIQNLYESNSVTVRNSVVKNLAENWQNSFGPLQGVIFDALVNFIKNCHAYPDVEVRNRAMIVSNLPLSSSLNNAEFSEPTMTVEKYYDSNEDFLLYDVSQPPRNIITEQMTAYPVIDKSGGDIKKTNTDPYAIFRQNYGAANFPNYMDFAIEICLDHSDLRLRRNLNNEPWSNKNVDAIHVQIIPSCGMQISGPSVAADVNGFVFNCDGQYNLDMTTVPQANSQSGVNCVYTNYYVNANYAAHTQLARVSVAATGGNPSPNNNAQFELMTTNDVLSVAVSGTPLKNFDHYFAGGYGEVHIYGLNNGYVLYPQ